MTKQIKIEELIPFMRKGWVAMDKNGKWCWFESKPTLLLEGFNIWLNSGRSKADCLRVPFNIKRAKDWTKSLIKVGGK